MISIELLRHGQPEWAPGGIFVEDPDLSELGQVQAECAAESLAKKQFDYIYVSPIRRALQTVRPISERLGMQAQVLPWLAELGHPSFAGEGADKVDAYFRQLQQRSPAAWWEGIPGGESFRSFTERVQIGMAQILAGHGVSSFDRSGHPLWHCPDQDLRLLIVAHAGTAGVILSYLLSTEVVPWVYNRFSLGLAGLWCVETSPLADGVIWSLRSFNNRAHLHGLPDSPG